MSNQKWNPTKRMMLDTKVVQQQEWIKATQKATGLRPELIEVAVRESIGFKAPYEGSISEDEDKLMMQVLTAAKASFAASEKAKKEYFEKEEKYQNEREDRREKLITAYNDAVPSEAIAIPVSNFVDEKVAQALSDSFSMDQKTGKITLKKGADAIQAFGAGFRSLNELYAKSRELGEGFAIYEARLAIAAKEVFGNEWPNTLAAADGKTILRIKKNMKAISSAQELGLKPNNVPIGVLRTLTEVNFDKEDEENNKAIKRKVVREYIKQAEKKGEPLTQLEAKKLIVQVAPERAVNMRKVWQYIYFFSDGKVSTVVGSFELDEELFDKATLVINNRSQRITLNKNGEYEYEQIPTYAGASAEQAVAKQMKAPKGEGAVPTKAVVIPDTVLPALPEDLDENLDEEDLLDNEDDDDEEPPIRVVLPGDEEEEENPLDFLFE